MFILLASKCSLSQRCSIENSFVHIAKKLRLETFIAATQSTIAKNNTGFTKDAYGRGDSSRSNQRIFGKFEEYWKEHSVASVADARFY